MSSMSSKNSVLYNPYREVGDLEEECEEADHNQYLLLDKYTEQMVFDSPRTEIEIWILNFHLYLIKYNS